jgi:helix-turn-helix protein
VIGFEATSPASAGSPTSSGEDLLGSPTSDPGVTFTVREAAQACAVHANTVRRRLKGGEFPNAYQDRAGTWRIPVTDLERAGLEPSHARVEAPRERLVVVPESESVEMALLRESYDALKLLEAEADELRDQVTDLRRRAAFAEALAEERSDRIDDLRLALRALEAINPHPSERMGASVPAEPVVVPSLEDPPTERRSFWRR